MRNGSLPTIRRHVTASEYHLSRHFELLQMPIFSIARCLTGNAMHEKICNMADGEHKIESVKLSQSLSNNFKVRDSQFAIRTESQSCLESRQ